MAEGEIPSKKYAENGPRFVEFANEEKIGERDLMSKFDVMNESQERMGYCFIMRDDVRRWMYFGDVRIGESFRNMQYGKLIYKKAITLARKADYLFRTSPIADISEEARHVWDALVDEGWAIRKADIYEMTPGA